MNTKFAFVLILVLTSVTFSKLKTSNDAAEVGYEMEGVQTANRIPTDINMDSLARLPQVQREG